MKNIGKKDILVSINKSSLFYIFIGIITYSIQNPWFWEEIHRLQNLSFSNYKFKYIANRILIKRIIDAMYLTIIKLLL